MSRKSWGRRTLIWAGPILTILLFLVSGFLYWVLTTTPGARLALVTAVRPLGGSVNGVSGSVWDGLRVDQLVVPLEQAHIRLSGLYLHADWRRLLDKTVHVYELSAEYFQLGLTDQESSSEESQPFTVPAIPVNINLEKLALGWAQVWQDHNQTPFTVSNTDLSFQLAQEQASLVINNLNLHSLLPELQFSTRLSGNLEALSLHEPWPFKAQLLASAQSMGGNSALCAQTYLDTLPTDNQTQPSATNCTINTSLDASGSLHEIGIVLKSSGQGMHLDATAALVPDSHFPLRDGQLDFALADGSSLHTKVHWQSEAGNQHTVKADLAAHELNVSALLGGLIPEAVLSTRGNLELSLDKGFMPLSTQLNLEVQPGTIWNSKPLEGELAASVQSEVRTSGSAPDWRSLILQGLYTDLTLGANQIKANGSFGAPESQLELDINAPLLADFWPDIPGGLSLDASINGDLNNHGLNLVSSYTPQVTSVSTGGSKLGQVPANTKLNLQGSWGNHGTTAEFWRAQVGKLEADHAGLGISLTNTIDLMLAPFAAANDPMWSLGSAGIDLTLEGKPVLGVQHKQSQGTAAGHLRTAGSIPNVEITKTLLDDLEQLVAITSKDKNKGKHSRGGVKVLAANSDLKTRITMMSEWDLALDQALHGSFKLSKISGDLIVPSDEPFPLGLEELVLDLTATAAGPGYTRVGVNARANATTMGHINATANMALRQGDSGFTLSPNENITANVIADINNLGWLGIFTGDAMDFGGHANANMNITARPDGQWSGTGDISASELRVVRIDDGVRLLDGHLSAKLDGGILRLEELYFPASLRVEPKETRTRKWLQTDEAQDGFLRVTGEWSLTDMLGDLNVQLHRFPILQRSDRFAMFTGDANVNIAMPAISVSGKIVADAGWADLDMLSGIDSVDSDVIVIYSEQELEEVSPSTDVSLDLEVDLSDRFFITGFGLDTGLTGSMRIVMVDNNLTALGALRTRGGQIEAYGQKLRLRRGSITFQGDITNPILDIEALRTGLAVEAGVKVAGTGKRPRIDLVSYPNVSEVEKLSWLLFGHGPDEAGGDMALLISVGTSLLSDGEPFYRRFGIDEVALRAGDVGSVGSILPVETVVSGVGTDSSELENQFIAVTKNISRDFTIGVHQALSDAGTVGRISYRLMRGLTAELSVGTTNGLALVYRWFSLD